MSKESDPQSEKLQRLLALKRYEAPPPGYFDNFLDEFHRRQRTEPIRARGWWEQMVEWFRAEPLLVARYALGTAMVALLAVNAYLLTHPSPGPGANVAAKTPAPQPSTLVAEEFHPQPPPSHFAAVSTSPAQFEPADAALYAPQLASNVQMRAGSHFVLDRVNIAPVSYDSSGDF